MAVSLSTSLAISCGCGFKTHTTLKKPSSVVLAEAKSHSEKTGHTLTVAGTIVGVKK